MSNVPTNIDDLLVNSRTPSIPHTPESVSEVEDDSEILNESSISSDETHSSESNSDEYEADKPEKEPIKQEQEVDDYGNQKNASKTYTEDEVNDRINQAVRDRLARLERNSNQQQPTQAQAQQASQQGFEYNSDSAESWQQQLENFVETTVNKMSQKQAHQAQQMKEQHAHAEFEQKFRNGMNKFNDYVDVVGAQPITDAMTIATRSMSDPAAFFYAASKRAPQELNRIAQIPDQYAQMVEIGKLEERMRQSKSTTKTPRPVARTQEDSSIPHKSDRQPTIEELIAKSDAKKRAQQNARRR
jgi:hypothetical protein